MGKGDCTENLREEQELEEVRESQAHSSCFLAGEDTGSCRGPRAGVCPAPAEVSEVEGQFLVSLRCIAAGGRMEEKECHNMAPCSSWIAQVLCWDWTSNRLGTRGEEAGDGQGDQEIDAGAQATMSPP